MLSNPIVDVAMIVAITEFFKVRLGLSGWQSVLAAFLVALFIALVPVIATALPVVAPWLNTVASVIALFLTAAGSFDFVMEVRTTKAKSNTDL